MDGSVTWVIEKSAIHSDEEDRDARDAQEAGFLARVRDGELDEELGLIAMGATGVRTDLLRDQRPFDVRVQGRFASLAEAFGGFLTCLEGDSWLETRDGLTTWRFEVGAEIEGCEDGDPGTLLHGDDYEVVLSEGAFVEAIGFELSGGVATMVPMEDLDPDDTYPEEPVVLSLTWTTP